MPLTAQEWRSLIRAGMWFRRTVRFAIRLPRWNDDVTERWDAFLFDLGGEA